MDPKMCHTKFEPSQPHRKQAHGIADALLIEVEFGGCELAFLEADWAQTLYGSF